MKHYIKKIYIIISLLSIFFIHAQTHSYIEMHRNTAEQLSSEYGIPSAVILAIAFVETGGGNSKGAKVKILLQTQNIKVTPLIMIILGTSAKLSVIRNITLN